MASVAIERACGIETIPHLTTRDMSIAGLESLLLGAHAEGVRNMLAVTGDPPEEGDYPGARGVYEVDAIGLTRLISGLNRGEDYHGRGIDAPTSFFVGVAVNPSADDIDLELERFEREAGGRRPVRDDADPLRPRLSRRVLRTLRRRARRSRCSSASGRCRASSSRFGSTTRCPASSSPSRCRSGCAPRGPTRAVVGRELARELIAESREKAAGVYLVAPFRQPLGILDVL